MFQYHGTDLSPGFQTALETSENTFWIGRPELQVWDKAKIDASALDAGNTGATGVLRAGLLLGKVTASNVIKQWNPAGTDGTQYLYGILGAPISVTYMNSTADRLRGLILVAGAVDPTKLLIPGQTALGIAGNANEFIIRAQLWPRIQLYPDYPGVRFGGWKDIVAKTANYTVTTADNDTYFTNRGASGTVVFTLPATPYKGLRYCFHAVAGQTLTVAAGTNGTMIAMNDAAANSISFSTANEIIGGSVEVLGDGTSWLTQVHLGLETQTPVIAT